MTGMLKNGHMHMDAPHKKLYHSLPKVNFLLSHEAFAAKKRGSLPAIK